MFLVGYNGCAWSSSSHWKGVEKSSNNLEFQFGEQFLNICREWEFIKCHSEYLVHEIAKAQPGLWGSSNVPVHCFWSQCQAQIDSFAHN